MHHAQTTEKKATKIQTTGEEAAIGLRDRVEQVRDIVETVGEKAQVAFRDRPYLVPVAAGAVGFGIGVLFGSKIARFVVVTAAASVVSDVFGGEIKRLAGDFMGELRKQLDEGEAKAEGDGDGETSSAAV